MTTKMKSKQSDSWRKECRETILNNLIFPDKLSHLRDQVTEYSNFVLAVREGEVSPQMYRNPFDIPRISLLDQLTRMRANFLQVREPFWYD